jgi:4-hydroxybenzoate polyprenyltransferase
MRLPLVQHNTPTSTPSATPPPSTKLPGLGLDIGVALMIAQIASRHAVSVETAALDLCLGHAIYGRDRLLDAIEANTVSDAVRPRIVVSTSLALAGACSLICVTSPSGSWNDEMLVCTLAIISLSYKSFKPRLGILKPLFIGCLWASAITLLPLNDPTPELFSPTSLLYTAASSLADFKDIEEDAANNITTVPVRFGEPAAYTISATLAAGALSGFVELYRASGSWGDIANAAVGVGILLFCALSSVVVDDT